MKRRVLLITNPGKKTDDNYCAGVYKDQENYFSFFKKPYGGYWSDTELRYFDKPSKDTVSRELKLLTQDEIELSIIIFCGHGWYSSKSNSNILEVNETEEIDSLDLRANADKRIIILDSCRKVKHQYITEELRKSFSARALYEGVEAKLNPEHCKKYYNATVEKCPKQVMISYGCNLTEIAGDDPNFGGYYSSSLLKASRNWVEYKLKSINLTTEYATSKFPSCHESSLEMVLKLSGGTQNPQIEKPRVSTSNDYLPFAIVA